ncbi:HypC/HybG/HupF family hydrogenase formation chaperone [Coprothermobacter platensis]|uniref:HypC/HybG/HupF family hydrogenase formation chaperone n=1 Tax=Coprothermobacter platensis TaxID=108819 RepID=UPI0003A35F13|nr:HypC/HybG/HupF family hydrogenase formation chaperone [Coprothermobacter platensis]
MCLGIPMQIKEINGNKALATFMNVEREIRIDVVPGVKVGDYVMIHAGMAIEIMEEEEAKETLEVWKELNDEQEIFLR